MEIASFSLHALTRRKSLSALHPADSSSALNASSSGSSLQAESPGNHPQRLKRSLNLIDLIFYGVGCSVGAGIYSLVGIGANLAGPSIALSFLLCGVACCFTSLCYAEFAARVPLAGSAYTFTYVSFGELCGWLVGWNLTLGYAVSAAAVARSWAEYWVGFLQGFAALEHVDLVWFTKLPVPLLGESYTCCPLAMVIIGFCTIVLVTGAKESTRFNTAMTILNLTILGFVLLSGVSSGSVHHDNLHPVFPHGLAGMARGAGLVFFSYLGFDMVACLSEEVQNPARNMPIGIIGSLCISMSVYVGVSTVVLGMAPVSILGGDVPIINALLANACCSHADQLAVDATENCLSYTCFPILHPTLYYGSRVISFGAIFGLTTATFACLMGQPRIFYSMALDGLLFKVYARVHPKTGVPTVGTLLTGVFTALVACLIDLEFLANAISLGTLQVFTFVNAGVILLRLQPPPDSRETSPVMDGTKSPLVRDAEAALVARSLGLVKQTSRQIRHSVRNSLSRRVNDRIVKENGNKPVLLVVAFTLSSIGSSVALANDCPIAASTCALLLIVSAVSLFFLPKSPPPDTFECPLVPGVPLFGIACNSYMMGSMPSSTWYAILLWLSAGLLFYFGYGIHHSELKVKRKVSRKLSIDMTPVQTAALLPPSASTEDYSSIGRNLTGALDIVG